MREIKGSILGRLPYYLVWQLPIAFFSFLLFLLHSTLLIIAHIIVFVVVSFYYCLAIISFYYCFAIIFFIFYFILLIVVFCRHNIS